MLLAGDIGGTKTLLGLFAPAPERPKPVETGEFVTLAYEGLEQIIHEFLRAQTSTRGGSMRRALAWPVR